MTQSIWLAGFGTHQLLRCIPSLTAEALKAWQRRGHTPRRGSGTGKPIAWSGLDVFEIAVLHEAARLGVPLPEARQVAGTALTYLTSALAAPGTVPPDMALVVTIDADGRAVVGVIRESKDEMPDACTIFRLSRLIEQVAGRIEAVLA